MISSARLLPVALVVACAAMSAQAQTTSNQPATASMQRSSVIPYTHDGYVGLSGGRSKYDLDNGRSGLGFGSDDSDSA